MMKQQSANDLAPVIYIPHGGGPLPLLGDESHREMVKFLQELTCDLPVPSAIVVISAHWEEPQATLTAGPQPELIYDYYGFPEESYAIKYPAPGDPQLAEAICELIQARGIAARLDEQRGFDHGLFVPLKLMYPDAEIPCVQLSLLNSMNPSDHIELGKTLASLREKNILFIGSGMSFHNLKSLLMRETELNGQAEVFDDWLIDVCCNPKFTAEEREWQLIDWLTAPSARFCHPREEHLIPLHVCFGIACADTPTATVIFNQELMGKRVTALRWA